MITIRSLVPLVAALLVLTSTSTANGPGSSCVVDVGEALAHSAKITDVIPLAEGVWINDVYVMPYTYPETYDRLLPDQSDNVAARQWVVQSFFAHNPDAYDFVAVVTDFTFDAGWGQHGDPTHALYWGVRNDTAGIGLDFFDHAAVFGSHRLQGVIDANSLELVRDPLGTLDEDHFLTVLSHELGHRWLAYCDFEDAPGSNSSDLLGVDEGHWSYLLDSDASYMYGSDWKDNEDGSFTATEVKARYSALDLYLMGMRNADEVEPFNLLANPTIAPDQYPELGAVIEATPTAVSVSQVISAEGPRIPSADDAPHELRVALVYLVAPGDQPGAEELQFLARARNRWQRRFFAQTEGRGIIGVGRNSLPVVSPADVDLDAAVDWLTDAADASFRWADHPTTRNRDTAAAIAALVAVGGHEGQVAGALESLAAAASGPTEVEAWRTEALSVHHHPDADPLLDQLSSWILEEGAWGGGLRYAGDTVTTARVIRALTAGERLTASQQALTWIEDRQNLDGGWSWRAGGPSATAPTLEAIAAVVNLDPSGWNQPAIQNALGWILARRTQGGFGDPHPDAPQTALFLVSSRGQTVDQEIIADAVTFLASRQRTDGSWRGSAFETALAVSALAPYVQPDLAVLPTELLVEPEDPFIEDPLTLTAAVHSENGDVAAGVRYQWEVIDDLQNVVATLDGVLPPIPATLFATVTDTWDPLHQVHPGTYVLRFTVDPLHELAESDEANNVAETTVTFRDHSGWIDLELTPSAVTATPPSIGAVPQTVVIDGIVRNTGHIDAEDAVIAVFEAGSATALASTNVTVQRRGEAPFQLPVQIAESRPIDLTVVADPEDLLNDADPSNNRVDLFLPVSPTYDPAVVSGSLAVTPTSVIQAGDLITIGFDLANNGTEAISGLQAGVSFTSGEPPATTAIRLLDVSDPLLPGTVRTVSVDWRPPAADPGLVLTVEVDPFHLIDDVDRNNNTSEITLAVDPSPLPNLVANHAGIGFDPEPALQDETVHISADVTNPSDNPSGSFTARLWIDDIGTGVLAGETTIAGLGSGQTATIEADWQIDEMADRLVWLEVDPDNLISEFDEDDNRDFRVLDVRSIPDLVVTSGQVDFDPPFPRTGDPVRIEITVINTGDQTATGVPVELALDDGAVVGATTIPTIAGGGAETVSFDWPTDGLTGTVALRVTADSHDIIDELDEDNNEVMLDIAVQDADLWVTEHFISPDGDGVKDATQIFVREDIDRIDVVDPWGEVVRMLSTNPPGSTEWDGRKDNGAAVRDGVYELRAGGLVSWVEVDLNNVTITDDVQQTLIEGNVAPISTHPSAWITLSATSPVDGVFYLTEWTGTERKVRRWNREGLAELPDWPDGPHTDIRGMSADETVFITWNGEHSLLRFPGPQIDPLPAPFLYAQPHLSPDGEWILWIGRETSIDRTIVLQRIDDLGSTVTFGPYLTGSGSPWNCEPTVHWAPGSGRAVVTLFDRQTNWPHGVGLALDIALDVLPSVREVPLEQACSAQMTHESLYGVAASVDMDENVLVCTRDYHQKLIRMDLRTGSVIETMTLPNPGFNSFVWYRLSNDGRAVEIDQHAIELKSTAVDGYSLLDWRRGRSIPWITSGYSYSNDGPEWSANDRYVHARFGSSSSGHFFYLTPAANLAVTLDPVVRFGGAGIDLYLTVVDRNLDHFVLEYAPASNPDVFEPLGQPSRETYLGQSWGTWIPPAQGAWKIRLTAVDSAGNERSVAKWVTWNGVSDIAGLWTESRHISPVASPGVKDEMVWQYTVLRPAQLLFEILDSDGGLIRRIPVGVSETGPRTTAWDGRDDAGRPVPDGDYTLHFRGAEWPVTVDNTPPEAIFDIEANALSPTADEIDDASHLNPPVELERSALFNRSSISVDDGNLDRAVFETRHVDSLSWSPVGDLLFTEMTESTTREESIRSEFWTERVVRLVATDRAGNTSVAERLHREEELAVAFAEPPCRSVDEPCLFPDRPDINQIRDGDGLMNDEVAVLWPDYSTLLTQSTVWGDWRSSLRLEFRVPGEDGSPAGAWQPGTLTTADSPVWRHVKVPSDDQPALFSSQSAQVLPVYWEHPGLPLRPYEVRLLADNRDGDTITGPTVPVVPKAPLAVEYLSSDAGGDHFRVHNISPARIDDIELLGSTDGLQWLEVAPVGSLEAGLSALVSTGCTFLDRALFNGVAGWVRVAGLDPWGANQSSLPAPLTRGGPPDAGSVPSFTMVRSGCEPGSPSPLGMIGYNRSGGQISECTSWSCNLGWFTAGNLIDLQMTVPDIDPTGVAIEGYELLIDGAVVAGAPDLAPGATGRVGIDLSGLAEGVHTISERYLFGPGAGGMLAGCAESTTLVVDRTPPPLIVTSPSEGQVLCPDQGLVPVGIDTDDDLWDKTLTIDGSATGITVDPVTLETSISVPALDPGPHTLEVSVVDLAGNAVCTSVDFVTEGIATVVGLEADPRVFSPSNTSGRPTETIISFAVTAAADYTIEILDDENSPVAASDGASAAGETVSLVWDGRYWGDPVPDGEYEIRIRLVSECGATFETQASLATVAVDTTPPVLVVWNPTAGSWAQTALELQALITDLHFERWEARIRPAPPQPGDWTVFATGERPSTDPDNVLAHWSITHLTSGGYEIAVTAIDEAGNQTDVLIPIQVADAELIASFQADPIYFSPNGDGEAEETTLSFELFHEAEVDLDVNDTIILIDSEELQAGVTHTVIWNGLDSEELPVPDGAYSSALWAGNATLELGGSAWATVIVDRIPPTVAISTPPNGLLSALPVTISGTSSDPHADRYVVSLEYPDGTVEELADELGDWSPFSSRTFDDIPDGEYHLRVVATDLARNSTTVEHVFTIDNTAPSARIVAPTTGEFLDPMTEPLIFRGVVDAAHPDSAAWWIAAGNAPEPGDFALLDEQAPAADGTVQYAWTGAPPADGAQTLRLTMTDQLGRSSEDRRLVTIDGVAPEVELWSPLDGALITEPTTIDGRGWDANLAHWTLEEITAGPTIRLLAAGSTPVQGELIVWDPLPADGPATLRLTAHDHAGHVSEISVDVEVSVLPPGAPVDLTAELVGDRDVALSWSPGPGPAPVSYYVDRDGVPITQAPVPHPSLVDSQVLDGVYTYRVTAVGPHGRESEPSAPATIVVNRSPPDAVLTSPAAGSRISAEVAIHGTAFAADDFGFWEIAARPLGASEWWTLDTATAPVIGGFMTSWNTHLPPWTDGEHELRLAAEDVAGNRAESVAPVVIDNTAPDPGPVNLQASLVALDPDGLSNDVQLTWTQNPIPTDLAGYYLYRNGLLANAAGPVVGDPSPYLLTETGFNDRDVDDGVYTYGVAAADTAGNVSTLSNPAGPITIDTRRPHAVITSPADGAEFEVSIEIVAECDDQDIASLDIQSRLETETSWTQIAPTFTAPPYVAVFTPAEHGRYFVRVLAADSVGPDPAPEIIAVTAADLPPQAPLQLTARADGDDVTLSWIAPSDPGGDLAGYDIERNGASITGTLLPTDTLIHLDAGLADGSYSYRLIAVDLSGQRTPSEPATTSIHTPFWNWIDPVTSGSSADLSGGGAHAFSTVAIQAVAPGGGLATVAVVEADENGAFGIENVPLQPGINTFSASSVNDTGETSLVSLPLVVVTGAPPDQVGALRAMATGSDVALSWTSNELESAGFEVARSALVINEISSPWPHDPALHAISASSGDPGSWPLVVDGNPSSGWSPAIVPSAGRPEWWSWTWPDPVEIDEVVLGWSVVNPPQIYDVDVLTPGGWLWLARMSWNGQPADVVPAGITATGIRVGLPATGACGTAACLPELTGIDLSRSERTMEHTYLDADLADGVYSYQVRERDIWGLWSFPTSTAVAVGPDQPAPPSDLTVSAVDCGGLELHWQPAPSQPGTLFGFRIYFADSPVGPFEYLTTRPAAQPTATDVTAPVGSQRFYIVTSLVNMGGAAVESSATAPVSGTAGCFNPSAPVITQPTVAGNPIVITPSQVPIDIHGLAVPGSTLTLLHDGDEVTTSYGYLNFRFHDVGVNPGINFFAVRQELQGNITESAPIEVELDSSLIPDVEAISLTASPAAAAPGELVLAEGTVALHAPPGESTAFDVAFELTDPAGVVSEVYRTSLLVAAGDIATVRAPWIAVDSPGLYDWRLVVDPDDGLIEPDEHNNTAATSSRVLHDGGLALTVEIDRSSYLVGQQLTGSVFFASSNEPIDYLLETRIEDSAGRVVAVLDSRQLAGFGDDWLDLELGHPLIGFYPGLYRVRAVALSGGSPAAEAFATFDLEQPAFIEAEVFTDRSSYPEGVPVAVSGRIHNLGPAFVGGLTATLGVIDEGTDQIVAQTHIGDLGIAAGGSADVQWSWTTTGAPAGPYRATLLVADAAGSTLDIAEPFAFTVVPGEVRLAATLELSSTPVEPGDAVAASVVVENTGSADVPTLDLTIALIDPVSLTVMDDHVHSFSLPAGAAHHITQPLATTGLSMQRYVVLVTAAGDDGRGPFDADLASATLEVADLSPPDVLIIEPAMDGVACDEIVIEAAVVDTFSRIDRVYHLLDDETSAAPLHLSDPAIDPNLYTATRPLPIGEDGPHLITVFAEDVAGNPSLGDTRSFDTDTAAPVLDVTGPASGSCVPGGVSFAFTAAEDHLLELSARLDGMPYPAGSVVTGEGEHLFEVTALDACGRRATDTRSFIIDGTAPEIQVSGVTHGAQVAPGTVLAWWVVDAHLSTAQATLDGTPIGPSTILDVNGDHTLVVTADDCAGNTADLTMSFTVTEATLALAGTVTANPASLEPGHALGISGELTNTGSDLVAVDLVLEVTESSSGTVVASHTETIDLTSSQTHSVLFAPDTTAWQLGSFDIRFAARGLFQGQPYDLPIGTATVTLEDLTPPELQVVSPTAGLVCGSVEVTVETTDNLTGVGSVSVTADGGAPLPLTQTGGTTWSAPVSLDDGGHRIEVVAVDGQGNQSSPAAIDIDLDSEAPRLDITAPDDLACIAESVTVEFSAEDPHLDEVEALLDGSPIPSGHVIDTDAEFQLEVSARDACGLQTIDTRSFTIDTTAPEISVSTPLEGEVHVVGVAGEWSATDDNLVSATATLDGVPVDPSFTVDIVGSHELEITAEDCADNRSVEHLTFQTVAPEDGLEGTLSADPLEPEPPTTLHANATAGNLTDTDFVDVTLRLEIVEAATGSVVQTFETASNIAAGAETTLEHPFTTQGLNLGEHELRFTAEGVVFGHAYTTGLAALTFEVSDRTPPALTVLAPAPGLACEPAEVRVEAIDRLAGVESVEVRVDAAASALALTHLVGDLWTIDLPLSEGEHQLEIDASDFSGNRAETIARDIDLDLTPPVLSMSAPVDGACLADIVVITFSAEDTHLENVAARLDGTEISSGAAISAEGDHSLSVSASDACGRSATHQSAFIIDSTPPTITVSGVVEGQELAPPVTIGWSVVDSNLISHSAALNGQTVDAPLLVDDPGEHLLIVEAEDCAGNRSRSEIGFTVLDDPAAGLVVEPPLLGAGGSILLLDRAPAGGDALETWFTDRSHPVQRVTDGCSFINELRRSRHDVVVLYAPTGAVPLDLDACPEQTELLQLAVELGATSFRHGGILVLGQGMEGDGCLGCSLRAVGAEPEDQVVDRIDVQGVTSIIEPTDGATIVDLRPVAPAAAFPLLVGSGGGAPECNGLTGVTLELHPELEGPWTATVGLSTPHESLDSESGVLNEGGVLNATTHSWVDLAVSRRDDTLEIAAGTALGGALPDWLAVDIVISAGASRVESSAWLPTRCGLGVGEVFDLMEVTSVESIGREVEQTVAASARRYGFGEALVLPWDILAPANADAQPLVEQALNFVLPDEEWPAIAGLPLPVTIPLRNDGLTPIEVRLEAAVPPELLLEVWSNPIDLDPVRWDLAIDAGSTAMRTVWLLPDETTPITIPFTASVSDGGGWVVVHAGEIRIDVDVADARIALRELRTALDACAASTTDPATLTILRDVLAAVERTADVGDDREAATRVLRELAAAFAAAEDEPLPCVAELRLRLADLLALWQSRWVMIGSTP